MDDVGAPRAAGVADGAGLGGDEPTLAPAPGGPRPPTRRRVLLAATGTLAVAVAVAGAVLAARSGDSGPDTTSSSPSYLLPGWLPEGWQPESAWSASAAASGVGAIEGETVVYGDERADDPWAGPRLAVIRVTGRVGELDEAGDEVSLGARRGRLMNENGDWTVTIPTDGGHLAVLGQSLARTQVLTAAEQATDEPAIGPEALPAGFAEIGRGGLDALGAGAMAYAGPDAVAVSYGDRDDPEPMLSVIQRPGGPGAVDLARFVAEDSRSTAVRGQHAVIIVLGTDDRVLLQWHEPPGTLVTVVSRHVGEDQVVRFAEGLRPAGADEVHRLVQAHEDDYDSSVGRDTGTDGAAATEECRELPDGTVECSVSASASARPAPGPGGG